MRLWGWGAGGSGAAAVPRWPAEFESYARELRRAKDQEEFDRFMSQRGRRAGVEDAEIVSAR